MEAGDYLEIGESIDYIKEEEETEDDMGSAHAYDEDDDDDYMIGPTNPLQDLPFSHEIELKEHRKTVTAATLDPAGSRLVTGGNDYQVKFWDFNGMDTRFLPFRSIEPDEGHPIRDLKFSTTGDQLLIATTSTSLKLYDRDAIEIFTCIKGDQYIRDMNNTKGHCASLTCCEWHPTDKQIFLTASEDATIRLWDVNEHKKHKSVIVSKTNKPSIRIRVTAMALDRMGTLIAGASTNGTIRIWPYKGPFHRPSMEVTGAHMDGSDTSSLRFSMDGQTLISRGGDDTLKVWDIRKFNKPVLVDNNLPNASLGTSAIFSPDEKYILTGVSVPPKQENPRGKIILFDRNTLERVHEYNVSQSSCVKVLWHPKINQVVASSGDGNVKLFYNIHTSVNGAKLCAGKHPKKREMESVEFGYQKIIAPNALPEFKETITGKSRQMLKIRKDPIKSRKPQIPNSGPGTGSHVSKSNFTLHVMKNVIRDKTREEDPREAILKYAKIAEEEPMFVTPAYKDTQPRVIFDEEKYEEEAPIPRRQ